LYQNFYPPFGQQVVSHPQTIDPNFPRGPQQYPPDIKELNPQKSKEDVPKFQGVPNTDSFHSQKEEKK